MNQDEQQLDLLAIFHYVAAAITALFFCFPLIHLGLGIAMVSGALDGPGGPPGSPGSAAPPAVFGWIFIVIPGLIILFGWTLAMLMAVAGRRLQLRTSYTYCLVVAGVECLLMPYGTILGVFTIVVLMRDSVRAIFGLGPR
jgi:hypothetical protein